MAPAAPGTMLGPYRIAEKVGEGGMGEVYKACDTRLDRTVAIKVLPSTFATDVERLRRFEREARAIAALQHPNILVVHDVGNDHGVPYLVTEFLEGESLKQALERGPLPVAQVIEYAIQVTRGLAVAHEKGIVHRDLKPDNVFVTRTGLVKILDFGLAKFAASEASAHLPAEAATIVRTTGPQEVFGTVPYMSPEQLRGQPVDHRSDIFSFGAVLYEMLSGRMAFEAVTPVDTVSAILKEDPQPLETLRDDVAPALQHIVDRCLQKRPEDRFSSASDLGVALAAIPIETSSDPRHERVPARSAAAATTGSSSASPLARLWSAVRARPVSSSLAAPAVVAGVVALLAVVVHQRREAWVLNEGLPELQRLVDRIQFLEEGRESWDAFRLANQIEAIVPGDPLVKRLQPKFTREISILSEPPGAEVRARYYDDVDAKPVVIGKTPLRKVLYPRGFTRVQIALPGRAPIDDVICNTALAGTAWTYRLHGGAEVPGEMAWVPGGTDDIALPGLDNLKAEPLTAFLMDRYEVTNREFKRFVDAGGYTDRRFWQQPFMDGERELSWQDAMARFVDRTGRPGPATWEVGTFPDGTGNLPVSGISWYEAAAYAQWAGKALPTVFHWNRVALPVASSRIVPVANLAGKGPVAVGSTRSMNRFGVFDLAGNVREWVLNSSGRDGGRFILGGGWNDPDYAFVDAYAQPPFDRSPTNGFRCIRYLEQDKNLTALQRPLDRPSRDYRAEKPVPDSIFAQYLRQFRYDKTPLKAVIEEQKMTASGIRQKITFDAAYGGERMKAFLFLPTTGRPPYQVVVVFPGSGAIGAGSSDGVQLGRVDFLPKSGRAVLYPIYKGTFERTGDLRSDYPNETAAYKDYVIMWGKDLARSIDYLQTRPDLDATRVAYYGLSWGAELGAILPAVETRIKANILYVAGLSLQRALPEADAINYVTHVKQPTLMLNGQFDFFFPVETSQRPLFDLLGTPAADKKRLVFPGGHSVPRTEQIKESLRWLDRYLGPITSHQ